MFLTTFMGKLKSLMWKSKRMFQIHYWVLVSETSYVILVKELMYLDCMYKYTL